MSDYKKIDYIGILFIISPIILFMIGMTTNPNINYVYASSIIVMILILFGLYLMGGNHIDKKLNSIPPKNKEL